jgi:hypothetical protein
MPAVGKFGADAFANCVIASLQRWHPPVGAVAFSPVTDLALTGETFDTRAEANAYLTKSHGLPGHMEWLVAAIVA